MLIKLKATKLQLFFPSLLTKHTLQTQFFFYNILIKSWILAVFCFLRCIEQFWHGQSDWTRQERGGILKLILLQSLWFSNYIWFDIKWSLRYFDLTINKNLDIILSLYAYLTGNGCWMQTAKQIGVRDRRR